MYTPELQNVVNQLNNQNPNAVISHGGYSHTEPNVEILELDSIGNPVDPSILLEVVTITPELMQKGMLAVLTNYTHNPDAPFSERHTDNEIAIMVGWAMSMSDVGGHQVIDYGEKTLGEYVQARLMYDRYNFDY